MPNVECAGSETTGWLCTIQPLPANGTSGLFRYSMPGASDRCTKDRCENYTAGLVSELDPHRRPCVVRRTGCFSGWPGIRCPRELSVWYMRPVSWTTRAVSTQRGRRFRCADADPMAVACRLAGSVFQQPLTLVKTLVASNLAPATYGAADSHFNGQALPSRLQHHTSSPQRSTASCGNSGSLSRNRLLPGICFEFDSEVTRGIGGWLFSKTTGRSWSPSISSLCRR